MKYYYNIDILRKQCAAARDPSKGLREINEARKGAFLCWQIIMYIQSLAMILSF